MERRIVSLDEFINESNEINVNDTSFKKGNVVFRLMSRYNPQLGTYYVFDTVKIEKITSASIVCDDTHKYDKDGYQKDDDRSIYGSSSYQLMNLEQAKAEFARLKTEEPRKVRGCERYLDV